MRNSEHNVAGRRIIFHLFSMHMRGVFHASIFLFCFRSNDDAIYSTLALVMKILRRRKCIYTME